MLPAHLARPRLPVTLPVKKVSGGCDVAIQGEGFNYFNLLDAVRDHEADKAMRR